MRKLCVVSMLGLFLCVLSPLRADETADQSAEKAKLQAQVTKSTQDIAAGGDELTLIDAYYERAFAFCSLDELEKAATDIDEASKRNQQLPAAEQFKNEVRVTVLQGEIALNREKWDDAIRYYERLQKMDGFETRYADRAVVLYNMSRAYAHADYPSNSYRTADSAIKELEGKTDARSVQTRNLALRQRAVALYNEGDLAAAHADWNAARAGGLNLDDAPFDEEQAQLNKAVDNGHSKERIARARFLMGKADSLLRIREVGQNIGIKDSDLPTVSGGTLSIADAWGKAATPVTLIDDALNDLDMAIHRDIGDTWGLQVFDIALERGKARSLRFQLENDSRYVPADDHRYSVQDVEEELNRAIKLNPHSLEARRARADWLTYRLEHLNWMARRAKMSIEEREKTRKALLYVANDDLARVLLDDPDDVKRRIERAKLTIEQPMATIAGKILVGAPDETKSTYLDSHAALIDLNAALAAVNGAGKPLISDVDKVWVEEHRNELLAAEAKRAKSDGTALEWKNKGNAANAQKDSTAALEAYNTALRIDPKFADALNNRSGYYRDRAQWDLALNDLDEAIRIETKHRAAYINRAWVKMQVGDFDGSVKDARRAVEVAPDEATRRAANEELLRDLFARGDRRSEEKATFAGAFDDYHEANALAATIKLPPNATYLQYEGTMAAQLGRGTEAITALRAAHAAKPDDIWIEGWLTVVGVALNDDEAPGLEKDIIARGDRDTLSNIDDIAISLKRDSPRLTTQAGDEEARLKSLYDRLFTAYRAKPGGLVLDGGAK